MNLPITKKSSPHFEVRANGVMPSFLILHYTESLGPDDPDGYFMGTKPHPTGGRVSAHYMIDEAGAITQYVEEDKRAWHAGKSYWAGVDDINSHSIGIELVNPGHALGYRHFPPAQMAALIALCREIMQRHDIPADRVLAHSDVAPLRKRDPGEVFGWRDLAAAGIGLWPVPLKEDFEQAAAWAGDETKLKVALADYGYNPQENFTDMVTAFQRHFQPEVFNNGPAGVPDTQTAARLAALLRMKRALKLMP